MRYNRRMNKRPVWPWLIGVGVLFAAGSYALRVYRPILTPIHDDIPCITEGLPLLQHLHPELYIYVNGTQEMMPGTIGHFAECEKVLHTHDDNLNLIHVEAQNNAIYTLEDFFRVWGQPIERSGYVL